MRGWRETALALALAWGGMPAQAQVTDFRAEGNLAPTVDPGCVDVGDAGVALSPPDLGLGVLACARVADWDRAVALYILMQLRGVYDTRRVADETAHQAAPVLDMSVTEALPAGGQDALGQAFARFGDTGGDRHRAFCATVRAAGVPAHDPSWMIRHGMGAFTGDGTGEGGDGLVPGFDAAVAWDALLTDYMKCGG